MRVLLVAPRTDLLYSDAEVQSILRSGLSVTPRLGNVGHDDVLADIDAENYDVFWFCGHATEAGLLLTDGPLTAEEFTPINPRALCPGCSQLLQQSICGTGYPERNRGDSNSDCPRCS